MSDLRQVIEDVRDAELIAITLGARVRFWVCGKPKQLSDADDAYHLARQAAHYAGIHLLSLPDAE